ncbi:MAG: hypothetical protein ACRDST_16630 [Pseudonocardiaceae bacterium]
MLRRQPKAAVCIVRVELQSWGPLITVTVNRDLAWAAAEPATCFSEPAAAAAAIADVLRSLTVS